MKNLKKRCMSSMRMNKCWRSYHKLTASVFYTHSFFPRMDYNIWASHTFEKVEYSLEVQDGSYQHSKEKNYIGEGAILHLAMKYFTCPCRHSNSKYTVETQLTAALGIDIQHIFFYGGGTSDPSPLNLYAHGPRYTHYMCSVLHVFTISYFFLYVYKLYEAMHHTHVLKQSKCKVFCFPDPYINFS